MVKKFLITLICTFPVFAGKFHPTLTYLFPLPGSELLSPKTTIIVKFAPEYLSQVTTDLIELHGTDGVYSGKTFFSTDGRTLIFKPDTDFKAGETITVLLKTSRFYTENFEYQFTTASDQVNRLNKELTTTSNPAVLIGRDVASSTDIRVINGVSIPGDFPTITTRELGITAPGLVFFGSNFREEGTGNYLIACRNDGTPYMYKRFDDVGNSANFVLQTTGVLSAYFFGPSRHYVLDRQLNIIDVYNPGHGYLGDDHELLILENGHALLISEQHVKIDMSRFVPGGRTSAIIQINMFQEFDTDKNVIFEWRTWDYYNLQDVVGIDLKGGNIDYIHMNSVSLDYDGHYIISARHLNEATKINRETGEIIWRLGGNNNQFNFLNEDTPFSYQHHFRAVPGQSGHYTLFDNGNLRKDKYSRAVEYKLDTKNMTAEKVWEYRYTPDRYSSMMGNVQRLPNGNTFIDWSTNSPVKACEVSDNGTLLFDVFSYGASTYRSHRFEFQENFDAPYLIIENYGALLNLIFNKFGDPDVAGYQIYHKTGSESFALLESTSNTWLQIDNPENNQSHSFYVTAVSQSGTESAASETLTVWTNYSEPGTNLIQNGEFTNEAYWELQNTGDASAFGQVSDNGYTIQILNGGSQLFNVRLIQNHLTLLNNREYRFEFDAYAGKSRQIQPRIQLATSPFTDFSRIGMIQLTNHSQHFTYTFIMENSPGDIRVAFECGKDEINITLENISLIENPETSVESRIKPGRFSLDQNFPNPFNASTWIMYHLIQEGRTQLRLLNLQGQALKILVDEHQNAGNYQIQFSADQLSSGLYMLQLLTEHHQQTRKLMIMK
jgi:hypothetical protein